MRENVCCGVLVDTADEGGIGLDTVVEAVDVEDLVELGIEINMLRQKLLTLKN